MKMRRRMAYRQIPLRDKKNNTFHYFIPDSMQELLHKIDSGAGGYTGYSEVGTNPHMRDRYIVNSLIQEAITSSQLEGAATTREVAKEMLRSHRPPQDRHERMILNNFLTMQDIIRIKEKPMSIPVLLEIHHRVTEGTLDHPDASGRFRTADEPLMIMDGGGRHLS